MTRFISRSTALGSTFIGAVLLATAPFSFAASGTDLATQSANSSNTTQGQRTVRAFQQQAQTSLGQAIQTAEDHMKGKALGAKFEMMHGRPLYTVRTFQNNEIWVGAVDAKTGKIVGKGTAVPRDKFNHVDMLQMQALQNEKTDLSDAVNDAQQQRGGKAIEANLSPGSQGKDVFDVHLVDNGKIRTAMVNPQSGKLE